MRRVYDGWMYRFRIDVHMYALKCATFILYTSPAS